MWELIQSNILEIIGTILTGLVAYIATRLKSKYEEYVNTETKQKIVKTVVNATEQLYKDLDGAKKLEKAKENIICIIFTIIPMRFMRSCSIIALSNSHIFRSNCKIFHY